MQERDILVEKQGAVLTVTFNRVRQRNAMTWEMYHGLYDACEQADADPQIRDDCPNEYGIPNHDPDLTGEVDNHQILTGSGLDGRLYTQGDEEGGGFGGTLDLDVLTIVLRSHQHHHHTPPALNASGSSTRQSGVCQVGPGLPQSAGTHLGTGRPAR